MAENLTANELAQRFAAQEYTLSQLQLLCLHHGLSPERFEHWLAERQAYKDIRHDT